MSESKRSARGRVRRLSPWRRRRGSPTQRVDAALSSYQPQYPWAVEQRSVINELSRNSCWGAARENPSARSGLTPSREAASGERTLAQSSVRVLRARPSGELGPEEAKEFRDTGKYGGKEHTQKGAECAERRSQIHVLVVSAENGGKQLGQPRIPALFQGSFRNTGPAERLTAWPRSRSEQEGEPSRLR